MAIEPVIALTAGGGWTAMHIAQSQTPQPQAQSSEESLSWQAAGGEMLGVLRAGRLIDPLKL